MREHQSHRRACPRDLSAAATQVNRCHVKTAALANATDRLCLLLPAAVIPALSHPACYSRITVRPARCGDAWRPMNWRRDIPSSQRYVDGELRVIAIGPTFASLVGESFDQIRGSSQGNVSIMLRMLGSLHTIGSLTDNTNRRRILAEHVDCIAEVGSQSIRSRYDRTRFEERLSQVRASLGAERVPAPQR